MNDTELFERLRGLDPAAIADSNKSIRVIAASIRPVQSNPKLLGRAYTVRCDNDFLAIVLALKQAQPGDILVIDTQASEVAVVGELFSLEASRRGLGGIVIDGACRDVSTIRGLDMPVYSRSITPVSGTTNTLGECNIAITCGGVTVNPGDILFGDDDGIIVGSSAELAALIPSAEEIKRTEAAVIARMRSGDSLLSMLNIDEHETEIAAGNENSKLTFTLNNI